MQPESTIKLAMLQYPADMIHHSCEAVMKEKGLTKMDMIWLLASYELQKPRIIQRTITDSVKLGDSIG